MWWTGNHVQADWRMRSADLVAGETLIETTLTAPDVRQGQACVYDEQATQFMDLWIHYVLFNL